MGKGSELLSLLKTGNSGEARKIIQKLKKQGKKKILVVLNEQDDEGCTPLHYAAAYNFLDFIEDFMELGAVVDVEDSKGYTPLHLAASNGRVEAVSVLLCRGADPDIASRSGDTPIHLASHNGHGDCVESLIREHAKCTMLNVSGQTSLDLACQNGHTDVVALLLRSGQFNPQRTDTSQTSLKLAAKHGHTQVLSILIKHGFDVNRVLPGAHGTCLHEAALYGKIEAVHYLLQCGANPSIKNTQGLTPLDIVNHYTDPRSAQQLKQLLKDALVRARGQYPSQGPHPPQGAGVRYSQSHTPQGHAPHDSSQPLPLHMGPTPVHKQSSVPAGMPSMAELIATKAANRKPMVTSSSKRDYQEDDRMMRSATLSGVKRPTVDRAALQRRRNSYSEETEQLPHYDRSNPPTLPRRAHPPTFKPVPPPAHPSPSQEPRRTSVTKDPDRPLSLSEQIAAAAELKRKKATPTTDTVPQITPSVATPTEQPMSLENELLAKLKRRQGTIVADPPGGKGEEPVRATPPEPQPKPVPTGPTPPVSNTTPTTQSSPIKTAPKPKPKPHKEADEPRPLTWQEEIAAKRQKEESLDKAPPPVVKPKPGASPSHERGPPPVVKSKPKATSTHNQPISEPPTEPKPRPLNLPATDIPKTEVPKPQPPEVLAKPHPPEVSKPHPPVASKPHPPVLSKPHPPEVLAKEDNPIISRVIEADDHRPTTPTSDQMSRSTSISSITSVPLPTTPGLAHHQFGFECVPISDWLASYKLSEYTSLLLGNGYDNTDFLLGVTNEELIEMGVSKTGHRKRIISALNQLIAKEHFLTFRPASVPEWLQLLGLSQYETVMIDNGYDDIEFIPSVNEEELMEVEITKRGHLKRLRKGIEELSDMFGTEPPTPSPYVPAYHNVGVVSSSHSNSNLSGVSGQTGEVDTKRSPPRDLSIKPRPQEVPLSVGSSVDSGIDNDKKQFLKMKSVLEKKLVGGTGEEEDTHQATPPPEVRMRNKGPPPVPKRAVSTILSTVDTPTNDMDTPTNNGDMPTNEMNTPTNNVDTPTNEMDTPTDLTDGGIPPVANGNSTNVVYSTDDISDVLDDTPASPSPPEVGVAKRGSQGSALIPELDDLDKALQGFAIMEEDADREERERDAELLRQMEEDIAKEMEDELKTDQMLADIDDMLADLNTHLDIMIPPTS